MPALAVALLLGAAVAHATWNYLAKGARGDAAFMFAFALCAEVVYLPIAVIAFVITGQDLGWKPLVFVTVSGGLNAGYFLLLSQGYRVGDLSLVYPLARGTGPALSVVGAVLLFGDRPSILAYGGAGLVVVGILIMSWSPQVRARAEVTRSVLFAVATGAVIATYTLWDSRGVLVVTPVLYSYGLDLSRMLFLAPLVLRTEGGRRSVAAVFREQRLAVVGIGVLSPGAYILVLAALTLAPVSYVAPAREISILFGALLGWRLLGESDPGRRLAGAGAIVAGVFALALG
ncbi:MAG: EamA family transporter [Chloroflexi bacterium]|nr:EamA family transporter [Chloroflexota bacterium]